jgi:hypothetical protein
MTDEPKRDYKKGPFDPDTLSPQELPEAMGAVAKTIAEACDVAFPTGNNPKRAELVACALLTVAVSYAVRAGYHPIEWLRNQVTTNEAFAKAQKAREN